MGRHWTKVVGLAAAVLLVGAAAAQDGEQRQTRVQRQEQMRVQARDCQAEGASEGVCEANKAEKAARREAAKARNEEGAQRRAANRAGRCDEAEGRHDGGAERREANRAGRRARRGK